MRRVSPLDNSLPRLGGIGNTPVLGMILIPVLSPSPAPAGIATGTDVLPSIPHLGDAGSTRLCDNAVVEA